MATQILGTDRALLLSSPADSLQHERPELNQEEGNVFRGFFYAMIFNVMLFLTGAAGWELLRLLR